MTRLDPGKLHIRYLPGIEPESLVLPRRYTLTHSDTTGDLFLTIGPNYDYRQISGLYTRLMRDEVLAEWKQVRDVFSIQVYCHVSGGLVFGGTGWRRSIFRSEMPLVLEAIRYGDRKMFAKDEKLDHVQVLVHLQTSKSTEDQVEEWGVPCDYRIA